MALIQWNETFVLGIPELDHEQRGLFDLIELLNGPPSQVASKAEICDLLADLHVAATMHFALEEKAMRSLGYDQIAVHKAEHERLLDRIRDVMEEQRVDVYANCERSLVQQLRD